MTETQTAPNTASMKPLAMLATAAAVGVVFDNPLSRKAAALMSTLAVVDTVLAPSGRSTGQLVEKGMDYLKSDVAKERLGDVAETVRGHIGTAGSAFSDLGKKLQGNEDFAKITTTLAGVMEKMPEGASNVLDKAKAAFKGFGRG